MHLLHAIVLSFFGVQDPSASPKPFVAQLKPAPQDARLSWSPKGARVPLRLIGTVLVGRFDLGHSGTPPVEVRLKKRAEAEHYDQLEMDLDRDGAWSTAERFTCTPKEQRGKWWSSFEAQVVIPMRSHDQESAPSRAYPMNLWFVADPEEPDAEPALRWSRRGFQEATIEIDGVPAFLLLTEMHMDGVFDQRDAWAIADSLEALRTAPACPLERHTWFRGQAYRATEIDADGRRLSFVPFDPGCTEAEERARADVHAADRRAPRAPEPLAFEKALAPALLRATAEKKLVFVDFQTTWCGPCREMERWVYSAAEVVTAAERVIPVMLDGDAERELVKRYKVSSYPTLLLLDAEGRELDRAVGYRSVAETAKFLKTPH